MADDIVELEDDAARALGRVTWWAINLEDVVPTVAQLVNWDPDRPVGSTITLEVKLLRAADSAPAIDAAIRWLEGAFAALERRNSVMHASPMTHTENPALEWLLHFPRNRAKPSVATMLTPAALNEIADQLKAAREHWVAVAVGLAEELQRRDGPRA